MKFVENSVRMGKFSANPPGRGRAQRRRFIAKGLREAKHAVDVATDGILASRQCQENDYDAVIIDVILPGRIA